MGVENKKPGEEYSDWKAPETGKPTGKDELIVGTTENPDGTIDYSAAATMKMRPEDIQASAEIDEQKKAERKRVFEVSPGYKPGSVDMVRFELKKKIFIANEALNKARASGSDNETRRRFSLLKTLEGAQKVLDKEMPRDINTAQAGSEQMDYQIGYLEKSEDANTDDLLAARELRNLLSEEALRVQNNQMG